MRKYQRIVVSISFLEVSSMDKGENQVTSKLPIEAILPLVDWQHDHRVGSKNQASAQIIINYLYEHGYLTDEQMVSIKERTKIFRNDQQFIEEKISQFKEKIIEREITETETKIFIPSRDLEYLKETNSNIRRLPRNEWERFAPGYYKKAKQYFPHPLAKQIIETLESIPNLKLKRKS